MPLTSILFIQYTGTTSDGTSEKQKPGDGTQRKVGLAANVLKNSYKIVK